MIKYIKIFIILYYTMNNEELLNKLQITEEENKNSPQHIDHIDYTKWEMIDRIGNVYNRLIMYRGDLFHVSLDYFGKDIQDGRLFQTFFFNTEK